MKISKTLEVKAHAEFGASSSDRWLNCPGSIQLIKRAPPQADSPYAAEGTKAHSCLEFLLKNQKNITAATKIAMKAYPREMIEHALDAIQYINSRMNQSKDSYLMVETKVDASHFTCPGQFGTLDVAIVREFDHLIVMDYKYGAGVAVDPAENSQLIYYALGLAHLYHYNFATVEIIVIQPRAHHESGETIRVWNTTMDALILWEEKFRKGVMLAKIEAASIQAGKWCKFCPAAVICPAIKNQSLKQARVAFQDDTGVIVAPEPRQIAVEHLGTVLTGIDHLETWIKRVREYAQAELERGRKIEGWKIVQRRSTRKWVDPEEAHRAAELNLGDSAFSSPTLLSPAQLEKRVQGNPDYIRRWVNARTTFVSSGTTLVSDSDRRQAVDQMKDVFPDEIETVVPGKAKQPQKLIHVKARRNYKNYKR